MFRDGPLILVCWRPLVCRIALPTIILLLAGCRGGGGGDGVPTAPAPKSFQVGGGDIVLTLDRQGRLTDARIQSDKRNLAAPDPQPVAEIVVAGQVMGIDSARRDGSDIVISFDDGKASVRFAIEEAVGRLVLRVLDVQPPDADFVRLRLAFRRLEEIDPALNGTYDEETIVCLRSINPTTRCVYRTLPGVVPQLGVEWDATHGIVGGAAALIATPRSGFARCSTVPQLGCMRAFDSDVSRVCVTPRNRRSPREPG